MSAAYDYLTRIVQPTTPSEQRRPAIRGFAEELGWTPSYEVSFSVGPDTAVANLVVEHGLENAAVVSFLESPRQPVDLDSDTMRRFLVLSYNNLVDWHLFVSDSQVSYVNNRTFPHFIQNEPVARSNLVSISDQFFSELVSRTTIIRNIPSCDDLLISIVSRWKRLLKADLGNAVDNYALSALLNGIMFVRACEDYSRLSDGRRHPILPDILNSTTSDVVNIHDILQTALERLGFVVQLDDVLSAHRFEAFKQLDRSTAHELAKDFYRTSTAPYEFNFAFMSKHALSRIYERFVSFLELEPKVEGQLSFLPTVPSERRPEKTGVVYTPQFIASFFARYIRDNMTPKAFRMLRFPDPACGSGIFARTLLEQQCDPVGERVSPQAIAGHFGRIRLIDSNPGACEAARLSLALLYLVLTGSIPRAINITCADAIRLWTGGDTQTYNVIIANPPYIKYEHLPLDDREHYQNFVSTEGVGRVDSYLAFVKLCLSAIEPGGFVGLVLPQAFLLAENAKPYRNLISEEFDVRCVVDLSMLSVFEGLGIYNILLVVQRRMRMEGGLEPPEAQVVKCQEFAGPALQACLEGRTVDNPYYSVFNVDQSFFRGEKWILLRSKEVSISQRLSQLRPLSRYVGVRQGVVTGADTVFIRKRADVPIGEEDAYSSFLPDRCIFRYNIPEETDEVMFYPARDGVILDELDVRLRFPATWQYLNENVDLLSRRRVVQNGEVPWWRPTRPRDPTIMRGPKIVCPHLMLTPRFALDLRGQYVVSRAPFVHPLEQPEPDTLLKIVCAVLNSSVAHWFLSRHAYKYRAGYNRLEVDLLRRMPMPDPAEISIRNLSRLLGLVDRACQEEDRTAEDDIDELVAEIFHLTERERREIMGTSSEE